MVDATPLTEESIQASDDGFLLAGGFYRSSKFTFPRFVLGRRPCCGGYQAPRKPATIHHLPDEAWDSFSQDILAIFDQAYRFMQFTLVIFILLIHLPNIFMDGLFNAFGDNVLTYLPLYYLVVWIVFMWIVMTYGTVGGRGSFDAFATVVSNHKASFAEHGVVLHFVEEQQSGYIWGQWNSCCLIFRNLHSSKPESGGEVV